MIRLGLTTGLAENYTVNSEGRLWGELVDQPRFRRIAQDHRIGRQWMPSDNSEIRLTSCYGKYPITYRVLYIPGGAGFLPWTESIIVKKVEHI